MSVTLTSEQQQLVNSLEDTYLLLQKTQSNLKKCSKQRLTRGYIETKLQCIEGYWQTFNKTHQDLVKCTPKCKRNEIQYFVNEDYFLVEDLYSCLVGDLKDTLSRTGKTIDSPMQSQDMSLPPRVNLPRIELPTFNGSYDDWPMFRDMFTSLVHNNTSLCNVERLHYLKLSLVGETKELLKHVNITDINYEQAWNTLAQRYGNKRLIVNSLLNKLFIQKKITTPSAVQIKNVLDTTSQCLNNLKNEGIPVESWDQLIIHIVVQKLDVDTHTAWEQDSYKEKADQLPTWEELKTFLETKYRTLELVNPVSKREQTSVKSKSFHSTSPEERSDTTPTKPCSMCNAEHALCHCKEFCKLEPNERNEFIKKNNLCYNCLTSGHSVMRCRNRMSCRKCNRRHHTLLHQPSRGQSDNVNTHHSEIEEEQQEAEQSNIPELTLSTHFVTEKSTALLATALVQVRDEVGHSTILRALIDQGSQANFITERAAQLLKVKRSQTKGTITGVGTTRTTVNHVIQVELHSRYDMDVKIPINAYVMPTRLTSHLPSRTITGTMHTWPHLKGLTLADPSFHTPGRVDMLLGVEVCAQILKAEIIKGQPGSPCAQNTSLGWILFGKIEAQTSEQPILVMHHTLNLDEILKSMWEVETDTKGKFTKEEEECERIYKETHMRDSEGRYIVKLPFNTDSPQSPHGNTKEGATNRLLHLERRFIKNDELKTEYTKAIMEYSEMKHMEEVPSEESNKPAVYLPHHAVVKADSESTKVRPVFDASHKGTNDIALNDELLVGPQVQEDMRSLVMRWRLKKVAFVADIQKMYRQILVSKEDADYQRMVWRNSPNEPIKEYRLLRVTFGTACAPYLAVKTLHQVANDEGENHPIAADTIRQDFYIDDLMSGQDTVPEAVSVAKNVKAILEKGGFSLQKWASNNSDFLKEFQPSELSSHVNIDIKLDGLIKTLGLSWNMGEDVFKYNLKLPPLPKTITKRKILAEVQRLFDPLGWLAPALVPAKIMIQKLWLLGVHWDEELSSETKNEWLNIRQSFEDIQFIKIKRWLCTYQETLREVTIHGYCDASTKAYGAVAYLRVRGDNGDYQTGIIAAKTKVAPVKALSLPRLELCGAVLLSKLLKHISEATRIPKSQIFCWTDSTIVLSWLHGDPNRWHTFVRNRVITILDNIGNKWYHIQSEQNPADVASRGMLVPELREYALWWHGPEHLKQEKIHLKTLMNEETDLERRKIIDTYLTVESEDRSLYRKIEIFENLPELLKTITYVKRFLKLKKEQNPNSPFTTDELEDSLQTCIKIVQDVCFQEEIRDLLERKQVKKTSRLKTLNPYLDAKLILRVGGRLQNANNLEHDRLHPIVLDHKNSLTSLLIAHAHKQTLHGGMQLMLNYLRSRYWILRVKSLVKTYLHKCFVCARLNARSRTQIMGELPKVRVTPARPFLHSGVDFAGPYDVLMSKGRGAKTHKSYIAIFICMSTKAIHLELVGDLTSEAFIAAFRRFVSRRGRCSHLWSDQGRNFVGANKALAEALKEANFEFGDHMSNLLAADGTQWHFIPAYSPNFGGLWEAGVKSMKYHLKRIMNTNLTYEEMTTVLCQVEACLNSRPLCPMIESDLNNLDVLTPGHFLIGESPVTIPSPSMKDISQSSLSRWQHCQRILSNFWHRWQCEYLSRLQQRPKWHKRQEEFDLGQIVLIKTDGLPPGKWPLGRVVDKHPGPDGFSRVYSVKSGTNTVRRSISKLCFLPVDIDVSE